MLWKALLAILVLCIEEELFAGFFRDVFVDDTGSESRSFGLEKCVDLGLITLDKDLVLNALNGIDTTKGDGSEHLTASIEELFWGIEYTASEYI